MNAWHLQGSDDDSDDSNRIYNQIPCIEFPSDFNLQGN